MPSIDPLALVRELVARRFALNAGELSGDTLLLRDTPCTVEDLGALADDIVGAIGREVDRDRLFLANLRELVAGNPLVEPGLIMAWEFPWLDNPRRRALEEALKSPDPFLTLGDMAGCIAFTLARAPQKS